MTTIDPHDFEQPGFSFPGWIPVVGGEGFADFNDPEVQVWENVTFADNYYQTVPKLDPNLLELTGTPAGRLIENADLNVFLGTNSDENNYENSRAGFTRETDGIPLLAGRGATHGRVVSWYDGTTNLSVLKSPDELYRRLGDGYHDHLYDPDFSGVPNPWYTPDHQNATFELGDENAPWEGIGTGWFYSVLGGGKDLRPELKLDERVPVSFDNTSDRDSQGDFPVPTVFNGNFEIVTNPDSVLAQTLNTTDAIPGWSFHQNVESESNTPSNQEVRGGNLVNVHEIPSLERHLELLGKEKPSSEDSQSYASELEPGESMTHNRVRVPDWGSLRFDLHVPRGFYTAQEVRQAKENNEELPQKQLKVTIESAEETITETFLLQQVDLGIKGQSLQDEDGNYRRDIFGNPDDRSHDARYKLDYATVGFETFQVDIPQNSGLHGKVANITFELVDESESQKAKVYVDDVSFQSSHLRFGKPIPKEGNSNASQVKEAFYSDVNLNNNPYQEALLLERPQYVLSYNGKKNTANWASWVVNQSWLHDDSVKSDPLRLFKVDSRDSREDRTLPKDFYQVLEDDYIRFEGDKYDRKKKTGRIIKEDVNGKASNSTYIRGHLVPQEDRNRNPGNYDPSHKKPRSKDGFLAVNLLSNIVPQETTHNGSVLWQQIENYTRKFVKQGNEVYVISGTYGSKRELTRDESLNGEGVDKRYNFKPGEFKPITIPQYLWRVMLVVDTPGADADENTYAVGFWTENRKHKKGQSGDDWQNQPILTTVREIENSTGYDFFANLPDEIEDKIETQPPTIVKFPK
ncbi:DNA/RNA non-specific endonuclease [Okeania sp. SIO2B3]|uniref:DNA/RNA non-specific endonuclease n=1 Tax=Okeania sp. SIO2B3 TaxID=2607784 RepID=UPI0013C0B761|nr:DNA/RNA non-specific endonuclease [Okeania sp. SIO2B3]NET42566.1 DNA/RNA non-specific endonuclease [Okeania sp. SIO2B3]